MIDGIYKQNSVFPKSPAGVLMMIQDITDCICVGVVNSLFGSSTISHHDNAFDYHKMSQFDLGCFVADHSALIREDLQRILMQGLGDLKLSSDIISGPLHTSSGAPRFNNDEVLQSILTRLPSLEVMTADASLSTLFFSTLMSKVSSGYKCKLVSSGLGTKDAVVATSSPADIYCNRMKCLYFFSSNLYTSMSSSYVSDVAIGAQIVVKAETRSRSAIEFLHKLLPGGVSDSYLKGHSLKAISSISRIKELCYQAPYDLIWSLDNNGMYRKGQSETPDPRNPDKKLQMSVWTMLTLTTLRDPTLKSSGLILQTCPEFSPFLWQSVQSCPGDLLDFGSQSMSAKTIHYMHQSCNHLHVYMCSAFKQSKTVCARLPGVIEYMRRLLQGAPLVATEDTQEAPFTKQCKVCKTRQRNARGVDCKLCGATNALQDIEEDMKKTVFMSACQRTETGDFSLISRGVARSAGGPDLLGAGYSKTHTTVVLDDNSSSSSARHNEQQQEPPQEKFVDSMSEQFVHFGIDKDGKRYIRAVSEPMPCIAGNPAARSTIRVCMDE